MALIVQKYGGTSVGTVERIQSVAERVRKTVKENNSVVVVVSAMGKTTDGLVKLAYDISPNPCQREMDMLLSTGEQVSIALLSMALQEIAQPAISLTGAQVGIVTECDRHMRARILQIKPDRIQRHLGEGRVVIVAGFQGVALSNDEDSEIPDVEITTLGRGGSDTSAVALAAALKADRCEIYTDVPGILTADPRLVPDAQLMSEITSDEMLELASLGAKVLHPRAVEIARNYGIPLVVKSSWEDAPGTTVISPVPFPRPLEGLELVHPVDAVEFDTDQAKVSLLRVPDRPGVAAQLFECIGSQDLDVDLIVQSIHEGNSNDIAFTVAANYLQRAASISEAALPALSTSNSPNPAEVMTEDNIAKVSIAGAGTIGRPGVAAQMFTALAEEGVNIQMISTSEVKVSCVVKAKDCDRAVEILCRTFQVEVHSGQCAISADTPPVRGVALDLKQARLALRNIPDRPGSAARVFQLLADRGVSVDTIIQSQRCRAIGGATARDLAFTVSQEDAQNAKTLLEEVVSEWPQGEVMLDEEVAKVSAVGMGMVHHPGTAAKMFRALSERGINIQTIATSEIKISCIVDRESGIEALQAIHAAFGLGSGEKITSDVYTKPK
ncbi:aspartate kinase [Roseofilum casamattae]|uniref:aspartate kinase n=1 Tax=Roseofilum casamattae BLCC-M143 TaxID=3022442 RepID=A0ABT7BWK5_9CYAN|nr:aspartate kinase [Roseofilum casamattae]MDJ1182899.1 aspartate kinase [Roseofilum casamattae BLCC-M143]